MVGYSKSLNGLNVTFEAASVPTEVTKLHKDKSIESDGILFLRRFQDTHLLSMVLVPGSLDCFIRCQRSLSEEK